MILLYKLSITPQLVFKKYKKMIIHKSTIWTRISCFRILITTSLYPQKFRTRSFRSSHRHSRDM